MVEVISNRKGNEFVSNGQVIPTGKERADMAQYQVNMAQCRAEKYAEKLQELGLDPEEI